MCTYNGAWTTFDEDERGSLEVGKVADICVLSRNLYEVPPSDLNEVKVESLILGGRPYKKQRQSVASAVLRGVLSKAKI